MTSRGLATDEPPAQTAGWIPVGMGILCGIACLIVPTEWDKDYAGETGWVYYVNAGFQALHISRYAFDVFRDHVATSDGLYYYFPNTNSFNTNVPEQIRQALQAAWTNFFTVR